MNIYSLIPTTYAQGKVNLKDEFAFGTIDSLGQFFTLLAGPAFAIAGLAVSFYFLIGALRYLSSGGDKNAIEGARNMITHAIIGFIMLIMAFLLLQFLPQLFGLRGFQIVK